MPRERELPSQVVCLDCDRGFNLLHKSHLRIHGYLNQLEYREFYGLDQNIPLHSTNLAQMLRQRAIRPEMIAHSREKVGLLRQWRRELIDVLAEKGLFTPSSAHVLTGIPLTTLQAAMQENRLSYGLACLRIPTTSGFANGGLVKFVEISDLYRFVKSHKPRGKS